MYKIYGDYGYVSETLLAEFDNLDQAKSWCEDYLQDGDFGGYNLIEIATFSANGEYDVECRYDPELIG